MTKHSTACQGIWLHARAQHQTKNKITDYACRNETIKNPTCNAELHIYYMFYEIT